MSDEKFWRLTLAVCSLFISGYMLYDKAYPKDWVKAKGTKEHALNIFKNAIVMQDGDEENYGVYPDSVRVKALAEINKSDFVLSKIKTGNTFFREDNSYEGYLINKKNASDTIGKVKYKQGYEGFYGTVMEVTEVILNSAHMTTFAPLDPKDKSVNAKSFLAY